MKKIKSDVQVEGALSIQAPTAENHAATKNYVDSNAGGSAADSDQSVLASQIFN